jgi:hypothetical protein
MLSPDGGLRRPRWALRTKARPMSALEQKQTWLHVRVMSALPPKADIADCECMFAMCQ